MAKAKKDANQEPASTETKQPVEKAAPAPKDEQNGVTRPAGGVTRRVWEIADEISAREKRPAARAEVTEVATKEGINVGTVHTQFGRWRKYYGLTTPKEERAAQMAAAKAEKEKAKAEAKAAKDAEKEAKAAEKEAKAKAKAEAAEAKKAAETQPA